MNIVKQIPNAITLLNLCSGVLAILLLDIFWSPVLILMAGVFDFFDGAVAKLLRASSDMGKELDSLCDMVSFGVAPALIYWLIVPTEDPWLVTAPLILSAGAALRLARFNTLPPSLHFQGLPSPASAFFITGLVLAIYWGNSTITWVLESPLGYLFLAIFLALFMNVKIEIFSLKALSDKKERVWYLSLLLLTMSMFLWDPYAGLAYGMVVYFLLGILRHLLRKYR